MLSFQYWQYNVSRAISRLASTLSQWCILKPEKTKLPNFKLFKTQFEFSFYLSVSFIRLGEASTRTSNKKCPNKKIIRPLVGSCPISKTTGCSPCLRLIIPLLLLWHEAARWGMNSCINLFFFWFLFCDFCCFFTRSVLYDEAYSIKRILLSQHWDYNMADLYITRQALV